MAQTPRRSGNSRNPNYNQPPMQNQPGMTQNGVPGNGAYYTQNQTGNQQGQRLTPQQKKARLRRKQEMIRRRRRHRRLLFAAAFLLIVGIAFFLIRFLNGSSSAPTDAGLDEVDTAVTLVQQAAHPEANIIFGASIDDALEDEVHITVIATGFEKVPFPPRASSIDRPATLPSQAPYVPQSYTPSYQPQTMQGGMPRGGYTRYDPSYQPVTAGYAAPQQGAMPGEPEVPAFVNEGAAGQRVSPYAAMPDMPMQSQQAPAQEQHEDRSTPRSFMDGIPAYMRRK